MLIGTFPILNASAEVTSLSGSGTADAPYQISSKADLEFFRDSINALEATNAIATAYYELTADIDLGGADWEPIGWGKNYAGEYNKYYDMFGGKFNGNNHVIKNFKITGDYEAWIGLFGIVGLNTEIKNLGIENAQIELGTRSDNVQVGVLIGRINSGTFSDCYVKNSSIISKTGRSGTLGAFVGGVRKTSKFENCYTYNVILNDGNKGSKVSGFAGAFDNNSSYFEYCYAGKINVHNENCATVYPLGCKTGTIYADQPGNIVASSLTPVNGGYNPNNGSAGIQDYNTTKSAGEGSHTYEAIVAKMVDGSSHFKIDPDINGGWPCLVTEKTIVTELEGGGSSYDPYLISNGAELAYLADQVNGGNNMSGEYFKLTADIDLGNQPWTPIGCTGGDEKDTCNFKGIFDGNGHVIKNLNITNVAASTTGKNRTFVGLFGYISGGTIKNLGIEDATINGAFSKGNLGGLIGRLSGGTVSDCYVKNIVIKNTLYAKGEDVIGGMIGSGRSMKSSVNNCYVYGATLSAPRSVYYLGGMIGRVEEYGTDVEGNVLSRPHFTNCYATNISAGTGNAGKLYPFGYLGYKEYFEDEWNKIIKNCYATDTLTTSESDWETRDVLRGMSTDTVVANRKAVKSTKAEIAAGLVTNLADTAYATNNAINNGYPSFKREIAVVNDTEPYIVSAVAPGLGVYYTDTGTTNDAGKTVYEEDSDYEIKVKLEATEADANAKVYVATYDADGRLLDAYKGDADLNTEIATGVSSLGAVKVKVFVWDENNTPIAKAYVGTNQPSRQLSQNVTIDLGNGLDEDTPKTRLVMIGDSIMDNVLHGTTYGWDRTGWEKYMPEMLNDDIDVIKHGHAGWSIGDFMRGSLSVAHGTCNWTRIKKEFKAGDYIIIGLGINDNSRISEYNKAKAEADAAGTEFVNTGINPSNNRIWFSQEEFEAMYKTLIAEAKAKGATVIMLTPTPGNSNTAYSPDNVWTYTRPIIEKIAAETGTPLINLTALFCDALNEYVANGTYSYADIIPQRDDDNNVVAPGIVYADSVHPTDFGARLITTLVTDALKNMNTGLEAYIKPNYTVMPDPLPTLD